MSGGSSFLVPLGVALASALTAAAPTGLVAPARADVVSRLRDEEDESGAPLLLALSAPIDPMLLAHRSHSSHSSHRSHVSGSGGGGGRSYGGGGGYSSSSSSGGSSGTYVAPPAVTTAQPRPPAVAPPQAPQPATTVVYSVDAGDAIPAPTPKVNPWTATTAPAISAQPKPDPVIKCDASSSVGSRVDGSSPLILAAAAALLVRLRRKRAAS